MWRLDVPAFIGHMTWRDLLFAHWPVPARALRPHVPARLEIEEFEGTAWLAVVPFLMTGIRLRGAPPVPGLSRMLELNVRTYVRFGDWPGVWFFSLDAETWPAVIGARAVYHLNYLRARMSLERADDGVRYESRRVHRGVPPAELRARYWPVSTVFLAEPGSLEYFLTQRLSLYAADRRGRIYRADIQHAPWPLQCAEVVFEQNTMAEQIGVTLPRAPRLVHYSRTLQVLFGPPRRL
jgi:hypothetical protein